MTDTGTSMWLSLTVPREMCVSLSAGCGSPCPTPTTAEVTRGTEQAVLLEQSHHLHVLALTACVRQVKDYTETQRQSSIICQGRRTRRCPGKVQKHGAGEGIEGLYKEPEMRPSDPTEVPWDVPLT